MVQNSSTFNILLTNSDINANDLVKLTGCSRRTAYRILKLKKDGKSLENRPRSGRPRKLNSHDLKIIKGIIAQKPMITCRRLASELKSRSNVSVSPSSVHRSLVRCGFSKVKPTVVPLMTESTRMNRLKWCHEHLNDDWESVFFSDESSFHQFRYKNKEWTLNKPRYQPSPKHPNKTMVWGAISMRGKTPLKVIRGSIDRFSYVEILNECLIPTADELYPDGWTFQQDNAPPHTARSTKQWFNEASSPDLNPIEMLWAIMKSRFESMADDKSMNTAEKLEFLWEEISQETVRSLILSLRWRIREVIRVSGWTIDPNTADHSV